MEKKKVDTMKDVLPLMVKGLSDNDIAAMLGISRHTVRDHIKKILGYFHSDNRTEATYHAFMQGVLQVNQDNNQ